MADEGDGQGPVLGTGEFPCDRCSVFLHLSPGCSESPGSVWLSRNHPCRDSFSSPDVGVRMPVTPIRKRFRVTGAHEALLFDGQPDGVEGNPIDGAIGTELHSSMVFQEIIMRCRCCHSVTR